MIDITQNVISPEAVISRVKSDSSGCVATYVGLIRNVSHDKSVVYVEYTDEGKRAKSQLEKIAREAENRWPGTRIAMTHRTGRLKVGEINLVIAVAAGHRQEGFAACQFMIDQFKTKVPTLKQEAYTDGSVLTLKPDL
jgi:molybdopterin synthase catalytic subunit